MDAQPMAALIAAARGDRPADLLLRNARLINVFDATVRETDIAVADGFVVGFGARRAVETVDLKGCFVAPGFIDAHVHIESAMATPAEFARAVLPRGTTAVVADPHEIANVLGTAGIDYMLAAADQAPMAIYYSLPSCVPATALETAGAVLTAADLAPYLDHPRIKALAEMMNFPGVIAADPGVLAKLMAMRAAGKPLDGHSPGLCGPALHAYLTPGIASDHECTTLAEAAEKLAAGMHIMVRQGTAARNLTDILPLITPRTERRMMWCTDDRHPHDLLDEGHIDSIVRDAIRGGVDPITAIRMATLNPAEYFRLDHLGAVAPGRRADLVVFDDLNAPLIRQVYVKGRLVAEEGRLTGLVRRVAPVAAPAAMRVALGEVNFSVPAQGGRMRVIEVMPGQIVTRAALAEARVHAGQVLPDVSRDLLKLTVVERHQGTGRTGIAFVQGFGLQQGALASSVAHDSHNIIAVGVEDADLRLAVHAVVEMGGGLVVVANDKVQAQLPLPIAGLMSDQPVQTVRDGLDRLLAAARQMGAVLPDPFMTLSFLALPVIPALKLTDRGLVDVERFEIVPLFE
jgi:adenine deaminase